MTKGLPALIEGTEIEWPKPLIPGRRKHREKMQSAPFIAWDGEGYNDEDGDHHYMLFGNSLGQSVKGKSLTYKECFPLLLDNADSINVIYGGNYDVVMMTKTLPYIKRQRLYGGLPIQLRTNGDSYRLQYFKNKYLLITQYKPHKRSVILYDVLSFFQTSFVKACREYLGDDETLRAMHEMKLKRGDFTFDDEGVEPYWQSELDYLVRLMDTLRELFAEVGIKPLAWYGPGAVAAALLSQHKMKRYYGNVPDEIIDIAERAYYGGRFEQFKVGRIEKAYAYDIRSAYPNAMRGLPDFSSATWNHVDEPSRFKAFGLYKVSWNITPSPFRIGPLPWRDVDGHIYYPLQGVDSWYWGIEVVEALIKRVPPDMYWIHEGWEPTFSNLERPFEWVEEMYVNRARMKLEGNPAERALKLGLNSLYGKPAQSAGAKLKKDGTWRKPNWHHILWAGAITAMTRAKLISAVRKYQASIIAFETDAIFSLTPLPHLRIGTNLGEWEHTDISEILYLHSGRYYAQREDGTWKYKNRGVESDWTKSVEYWKGVLSQLPWIPQTIEHTMTRFGTDIRQSEHFGKWYPFTISTKMPNSMSKRVHVPSGCITCKAESQDSYADRWHNLVVPQPVLDSEWRESSPYDLPWRDDVSFHWPEVVRSEVIETPEDYEWE